MSAALSHIPAVPERIAQIIYVLCQTLTMRLRTATLTHAQLTYIVGRLLGIRKRFQRLVACIRAGQTPRERARRPREAAPAPEFPLGFRPPPPGWRRWAVRADKPVPTWRSLRQNTFGWLLPLAAAVPDFRDSTTSHRGELLGLLAEPETRALLLASRRVGDSLRPLCWMLGIESSALYPARPAAGAVVLPPDPFDPAPDENGVCVVAAPGPFLTDVLEPTAVFPHASQGDDFLAVAKRPPPARALFVSNY